MTHSTPYPPTANHARAQLLSAAEPMPRHQSLYARALLSHTSPTDSVKETSGDPEPNQGPSDVCTILQSDALPTELSPVLAVMRNASCQK